MNRNKRIILIILATFGLVISSYLTFVHFSGAELEFCVINGTFDCDKVNNSVYAKFLGVPVSLGGVFMNLIFILYGLNVFKKIKDNQFYIKILITLALLFTLYLMYLEAFVLRSWCIFCIVHSIIIFIIFYIIFSKKNLPVHLQTIE